MFEPERRREISAPLISLSLGGKTEVKKGHDVRRDRGKFGYLRATLV